MIRRGIGVGSFVSAGMDDAQLVIAAIEGTGVTLTTTQKNACATLINDFKIYGLWSKMKAIYGFLGGTAGAHKFNWKDPRDLDLSYRLVFNGGWTHSATGATPNGTNAYGDTKLTPSANLTQNSTHISYYSRTNALTESLEMGVLTATSARFSMELSYLTNGFRANQYNNATGQVAAVNSNTTGYYISSRTNSTTHKAFKNNAQLGSTNTGAPGNISDINLSMYIGGVNRAAGVIYSTKQVAFVTIGDGLTDTEAANLYTAVQAYQTALSRNV